MYRTADLFSDNWRKGALKLSESCLKGKCLAKKRKQEPMRLLRS